jgi:hypothetical protein
MAKDRGDPLVVVRLERGKMFYIRDYPRVEHMEMIKMEIKMETKMDTAIQSHSIVRYLCHPVCHPVRRSIDRYLINHYLHYLKEIEARLLSRQAINQST